MRGFTIILLLLTTQLLGCGARPVPAGQDNAFRTANEAANDGEWSFAAAAAWSFIQEVGADDTRYDRALLVLAQALEGMGLTYPASLYYLEVARNRRDAELIDDAIIGLERIVRTGLFDEPTIIRGFISTADISGLPAEAQTFVNYYRGVDSLRRGLDEWGVQLLSAIDEDSAYGVRARYALAVRTLSQDDLTAGRAALEALLAMDEIPADVNRDVHLALARLAMDEERFDDAVTAYEEVRTLAPERPDLLLEMAWAHFYRGDSRRALGLLIALDAPTHQGLIAPERFLLEAFCLRRLCQLDPARTAANRLSHRYRAALDDIHQGVLPIFSRSIRQGAKRRGTARALWLFGRQLRREQGLTIEDESQLGESLTAHLTALYTNGRSENDRRLEAELYHEANALATELIGAEDGVRLILHELSVQLLRGRRRPEGPDEVESLDVSAGTQRISYRFHGEFWTDELDELVVDIPDRCLD